MAFKKLGFPPQIKYIVGNEACERFSYYGMRSILVVFMIDYLRMPEPEAKSVYHLFMTAAYFLPLFGAILADRFVGKYHTIFWLSLVYCLGHGVLAVFETKAGLLAGLGLIALGAGGIKPCVSTLVGDQFGKGKEKLVEKVFEIFYFSINFGAFTSSVLIPLILPKFGPSIAFGIPGVLMALATLIFWLGRKHYVLVPPTGKANSAQIPQIVAYGLRNLGKKAAGEHWLDTAKKKYAAEKVEGVKAIFGILRVFVFIVAFWALFDQTGSTWVIQAQKMDLNFLGMKLEGAQIQALNPILILVLIPVFSLFIYPAVERLGIRVTALRKMSTGMALMGFSFVLVGFFQVALDAGRQLSVAWQFLPFLILTSSEIMVSITGMEFAYTQAPPSMKSTIMSLFFLTIAAGNFLTAMVSYMNPFQGAMEFFFYAGLMFVVAGLFIFSAYHYKERSYLVTAG